MEVTTGCTWREQCTARFVARKWKQASRSDICFQAGVHEQNVKPRSDDARVAGGFASVGEAARKQKQESRSDIYY